MVLKELDVTEVTENAGTVINNVVIVSGGQQGDPVTDTRIHSPQTPFPFRLPRNTEQSFQYCTVGTCWLSTFFFFFEVGIAFIGASAAGPLWSG